MKWFFAFLVLSSASAAQAQVCHPDIEMERNLAMAELLLDLAKSDIARQAVGESTEAAMRLMEECRAIAGAQLEELEALMAETLLNASPPPQE